MRTYNLGGRAGYVLAYILGRLLYYLRLYYIRGGGSIRNVLGGGCGNSLVDGGYGNVLVGKFDGFLYLVGAVFLGFTHFFLLVF